MPGLHEVIGDPEPFITRIDGGLARLGIKDDELAMMDHIAYRVETRERYQSMLELLKSQGALLGEATVGGRRIATFELADYIRVGRWVVPYIELPEPKEGSPYSEGLEHAELVVIGGLTRFIERHAELPFDRKGLDKQLNPELGLKTGGISVKFHEQPLGAVVRIEQRLGLS